METKNMLETKKNRYRITKMRNTVYILDNVSTILITISIILLISAFVFVVISGFLPKKMETGTIDFLMGDESSGEVIIDRTKNVEAVITVKSGANSNTQHIIKTVPSSSNIGDTIQCETLSDDAQILKTTSVILILMAVCALLINLVISHIVSNISDEILLTTIENARKDVEDDKT